MRMLRFVLAICASLWFGSAQAQIALPFPGPGAASVATYQGPGDIVASASMWGSCARAYTAAFAAGAGPICDLIDIATGTFSCTMNIKTNGFADLTSLSCAGGTVNVVTFCTVTHAAGCIASKIYDQTGNGNHCANASLSQGAGITFGALNGLPGLIGTNAAANRVNCTTPGLSSPYSASIVFKRTGSTTSLATFYGDSTVAVGFGAAASANTSSVSGTTQLTQTANDNAFHSLQGVISATVGAINTDGTDSGNSNSGATGITQMRLLRASAGVSVDGILMEFGLWNSALNATQRGNLGTNQHSAASGYNF